MNNPEHIITLRNATINDLDLLQSWDKQKHVITSDPNSDWDWETELTYTPIWRQQLIAQLDDQPLGFIQIIDPEQEETHYWGKVEKDLRAIDLWIGQKENLGKGYGTIMMQRAIEICFADIPVTAILVDPLENNKKAIKFYKKLGFKFVENRFFDEDYCSIYKLHRADFKT